MTRCGIGSGARLRKWGSSGAWPTTASSANTTSTTSTTSATRTTRTTDTARMPFVHLRHPALPAHPHCFRMLNCWTPGRQVPCIWTPIQDTYVHTPFPPLPLCMLLLLSYTRNRVALGTCLVWTRPTSAFSPRNNIDVRVLILSSGGVARTQRSSSQLSNTGIHPSLNIPPTPPFSQGSLVLPE